MRAWAIISALAAVAVGLALPARAGSPGALEQQMIAAGYDTVRLGLFLPLSPDHPPATWGPNDSSIVVAPVRPASLPRLAAQRWLHPIDRLQLGQTQADGLVFGMHYSNADDPEPIQVSAQDAANWAKDTLRDERRVATGDGTLVELADLGPGTAFVVTDPDGTRHELWRDRSLRCSWPNLSRDQRLVLMTCLGGLGAVVQRIAR